MLLACFADELGNIVDGESQTGELVAVLGKFSLDKNRVDELAYQWACQVRGADSKEPLLSLDRNLVRQSLGHSGLGDEAPGYLRTVKLLNCHPGGSYEQSALARCSILLQVAGEFDKFVSELCYSVLLGSLLNGDQLSLLQCLEVVDELSSVPDRVQLVRRHYLSVGKRTLGREQFQNLQPNGCGRSVQDL